VYFRVGSPRRFAEQLAALPRAAGDYLLILLADRHLDQLEEIVFALKGKGLPFFGAIVPAVFRGVQWFPVGAVVRLIPCLEPPAVALLQKTEHRWLGALPAPSKVPSTKPLLYMFVDSLAPGISRFLGHLFNRYGNTVSYFGGGAGNQRLEPAAAVFTPDGIYRNASVAVVADLRGEVSVQHGWERVAGPFVATSTRDNIIEELDWEPALEFYRQLLPASLREVAAGAFYDKVAASYPFGIQKIGREDIVRDSIRITEAGGLVCLSDVPAYSVLYLLHGERQKLIEAAEMAMEEVVARRTALVTDCLACDCFSRMLFLGQDYCSELEAVAGRLEAMVPSGTIEGGIVLGEIASDGEQSLEFYNKTFVVNALYGWNAHLEWEP
jgi:hypothetical protein